jgi:hypothetical protein
MKVEDLVSAGIIDPDGDSLGIAVSGLTGTANGQWQFSTDGTTWQNIGAVSATSALLLANSDFIPLPRRACGRAWSADWS